MTASDGTPEPVKHNRKLRLLSAGIAVLSLLSAIALTIAGLPEVAIAVAAVGALSSVTLVINVIIVRPTD